jgi:hypothetical protein
MQAQAEAEGSNAPGPFASGTLGVVPLACANV